MKKKNTILTYLLSLGALAATCQVSALAQTNAAASSPPAQAQEEESRFQKGEIDLAPFGAYVDKTGGKWGAGAALTYYVTDKIGVGAATYWTETRGTFFDNAEAEGYFRLPLLKIFAPYAVASVGYQFDRQYWFETVGAGLDFRPFKHIEAFGDAQYRIANNSTRNGVFLRLGVRFSFR